jgi:uncharacterized protein (DUF2267 family)
MNFLSLSFHMYTPPSSDHITHLSDNNSTIPTATANLMPELMTVESAAQIFSSMPLAIRDQFQNDPGKWQDALEEAHCGRLT